MAAMDTNQSLVVALGLLGYFLSFLVFLAPIPVFARIYKNRSTEGFDSSPYLVALFSAMLWLLYAGYDLYAGYEDDISLLVIVNSFGSLMEIVYVTLYITYAPPENKGWTIRVLAIVNLGAYSLILLLTCFLADGSTRVEVTGWICVVVSGSVFAAPLIVVPEVIRTRSAEFMPITLSFFLTLSATVWLMYGVLAEDIFAVLPNSLGLTLGLVQLLLYSVYWNANSDPEEANPQIELRTYGSRTFAVERLGDPNTYQLVVINQVATE